MVNKKIIAYGTLIMFQTDHNAQFPMNASKEWYKLSTYVRGLVTHSSKQLLSSFLFFFHYHLKRLPVILCTGNLYAMVFDHHCGNMSSHDNMNNLHALCQKVDGKTGFRK